MVRDLRYMMTREWLDGRSGVLDAYIIDGSRNTH